MVEKSALIKTKGDLVAVLDEACPDAALQIANHHNPEKYPIPKVALPKVDEKAPIVAKTTSESSGWRTSKIVYFGLGLASTIGGAFLSYSQQDVLDRSYNSYSSIAVQDQAALDSAWKDVE